MYGIEGSSYADMFNVANLREVGLLSYGLGGCGYDDLMMKVGRGREHISFPPANCDNVTWAANFNLKLSVLHGPQAIEQADGVASFHPYHRMVLDRVEQELRRIVDAKLQDLDGSEWVDRRVPPDVKKRWADRQDDDRRTGRPVYALIQYADFMDLCDLILKKKNWREAFVLLFQKKEDIGVSMSRLHPIRKAIAHNRPLSPADELTLIAEGTRILRACGIQILN